MSKVSLDILLVERAIASDKKEAQGLILSGVVLVDDIPIDKIGAKVSLDSSIRIKGVRSKYVSRGGDKLIGAIKDFSITSAISNRICLDLGSSTGGFTDCLLQEGAAKVYAVDVGTAQLADKLRKDTRVVIYEKTHAQDIPLLKFNPRPTLAVIDVSFISLCRVLPFVDQVIDNSSEILALIKPQFELTRNEIEAGGIVSCYESQEKAIELVRQLLKELNYEILGVHPSRVKGQKKGNQEYFIYAKKL